ncbi:spermidine/putrescine ABC transporter substrate-binding protein [Oceanimonas pelagia]|uniref:Spermidine/putrescine ABC transporter substrate-binding protein n=1 Tax=Oceanimonas pelagia TaxID=3028314 RepID=A0AA50KNJ0_9GAMM|nr:spermidine/putrescine ABC transporter substrate-binding protein [Oceanimonas pelagia]WMC10187.1 spermidine/putrescine ABC transporter substrate-binding protein [Oceanimonas pelagia]
MNSAFFRAGGRHLVLCAGVLLSLPQAHADDRASELTFLTWGDYIDEGVVADFEAEFNASIRFVHFESDAARHELLTISGVQGYDLILVDSVSRALYQHLGWIGEFDRQQIPNLGRLRLPAPSVGSHGSDLCVPYTWGTTGIAYRTDLVSEPVTRWQQLFEPAEELQGKILMSEAGTEVVGMALKALGYSMASSDPDELEQARQLLNKQAPLIAGYAPVAVDSAAAKLVTGEVSAVLTYSGDALMLKEFQPNIEYVLPEEGGAIWADFICLGAQPENAELAHRFIDFLNRPEQSARNSLYIYSATPNVDAEALLPADFLTDPVIYPDRASLDKSEHYRVIPPRIARIYNNIMQEVQQLSE